MRADLMARFEVKSGDTSDDVIVSCLECRDWVQAFGRGPMSGIVAAASGHWEDQHAARPLKAVHADGSVTRYVWNPAFRDVPADGA